MRPDMVTTSRESKKLLPAASITVAHRNPWKGLQFKMLFVFKSLERFKTGRPLRSSPP